MCSYGLDLRHKPSGMAKMSMVQHASCFFDNFSELLRASCFCGTIATTETITKAIANCRKLCY